MKELLHSQFFIGGFMLMLSGAMMAILRRVPDDIYTWMKDQFSVRMTVLDNDPIFEALLSWLDAHPYSRKTRNLTASTLHEGEEQSTMLSPGVGNHLLKFKGRWVWLHRKREDISAPSSGGGLNSRNQVKMENITLTMMGRSQDALRQLLIESGNAMKARTQDKVAVYVAEYGYWRKLRGANKRPLTSVMLPDGQSEELMSDVHWFLHSRESYNSCNVPYRRGYCFYGLAGSGKTSTVMAIASELNLSLYVLPLSLPNMDDQQLSSLMLMVRPGSVILLEDVDAANLTRETVVQESSSPTKSSGITLSGLLNCLDGVAAQEGCLIFMTTNHIEKLDSALIRPGRVDVQVEFKNATASQITRAYHNFFPNSNGDAEKFLQFVGDGVVMCKVQQELMRLKFKTSGTFQAEVNKNE